MRTLLLVFVDGKTMSSHVIISFQSRHKDPNFLLVVYVLITSVEDLSIPCRKIRNRSLQQTDYDANSTGTIGCDTQPKGKSHHYSCSATFILTLHCTNLRSFELRSNQSVEYVKSTEKAYASLFRDCANMIHSR